MNLIPKINGRMVPHKGRLTVHEPLSYSGELRNETYAMRFGLLPASEGMLFLNTDPDLPEEGYRLVISSSGIELTSSAQAGQFYGLITLESLLRENRGGLLELDSKIPYMEIEDHPRFSYRGFMLDVSRHFTGVTEIERLLEQMALLKLNKFHWHLSDDEGLYTVDEIREIVAFAADRAIEVVQEIDPPGQITVQFWSEEPVRPEESLRSTYEYEPNVAKDYNVPKEQVLGVEAGLRTEGVQSVDILQKRIFPRLLALSENAWTEDRNDYDDFLKRVKEYLKVLKDYDIQYTPLSVMTQTRIGRKNKR